MIFQQWISYQDYVIENSALYAILPISYTSNYIVEITDGGEACVTYSPSVISNNKFRVYNYDRRGASNFSNYKGRIFTIGY